MTWDKAAANFFWEDGQWSEGEKEARGREHKHRPSHFFLTDCVERIRLNWNGPLFNHVNYFSCTSKTICRRKKNLIFSRGY